MGVEDLAESENYNPQNCTLELFSGVSPYSVLEVPSFLYLRILLWPQSRGVMEEKIRGGTHPIRFLPPRKPITVSRGLLHQSNSAPDDVFPPVIKGKS